MADLVTRLKVDSKEYESKIERARSGLLHLEQSLQKAGKSFASADEEQVAFVKELGKMETVSQTAKGKVGELSKAFIDLSVQYKKMTDQEKESPFGKAMAQSLNQLKTRVQDAKNEIKELEGELNGSQLGGGGGGGLFGGDKFGGMIQVLGGNLMTKAVGMFANLASEMGDMVVQGIELAKQGEGIRIAFERLGRGDILNGLREATHGTVTDVELMKAAVKFNDFKLPIEELGTMLAFAQQKAKDTGQSVDYMVDSIVTGLGRKSLMILDNLGLSAAEIKDKMAQTGDMTKAVGAIIREQMAKAGSYIETAADKATEANVRLKNAMTELGNTLTPLSSDFGNFWNELKIGGLNFLNTVLTPIVNKMTQAGQIAGAKARMGGSDAVDSQIDALTGSSTKQLTMLSQLAKYDQQIKELQSAADSVVVPAAGQGSQYAINQINAYNTQIQALIQMREEYRQKAMDIIAPKVTENAIVAPAGGTGGKKGTTAKPKEEYIPLVGSIDWMQQQVKELQTAFEQTADEAVRGKLYNELQKVKLVLDSMNAGMSMTLERTSGSVTESMGLGIQVPQEIDNTGGNVAKAGEDAAESWNKAVNSISGVGSALAGIENPAVKVLGIVAEAIATVALSFSKALSHDTKFGVFGWIAAAAAGTATMISTIAAIKSATSGFANGGIVPGNYNSGDQLRTSDFGISSGELVLNRAQQGVIAAALQQESYSGRSQQSVVIHGEDLIIALNNAYRRRGMGEIVTTKGR